MADLAELVQGYRDVQDSWSALAHDLPEDAWDLPTGCPGWSVRDNLAHVVGIEAVMAGDDEPDVEVPDLPHLTGDAGRYMETHVQVRRGRSIDALLAEMDDVFARRRQQVEAVTDLGEELPSLGGATGPAAGVLSLRIFDSYAHEQDVRRATGRPGHLSGPATDVTLRRIVRGLGFYLPTRVEGMGGTLRIDVTDRPDDVLAFDLADGERLEPAPDDPTVCMATDWSGLVALTCGRADAPTRAELDVTGPGPLVDRVLLSLAITP